MTTSTGASCTQDIDPLALARNRGHRYAVEQYCHPDNLPLQEACSYSRRHGLTVIDQWRCGGLYALVPPDSGRGLRYPKWQFDVESSRLAATLKPSVDVGANWWVIHAFMLGRHYALDGSSPAQVIGNSRAELAPVINLATLELADEQRAS